MNITAKTTYLNNVLKSSDYYLIQNESEFEDALEDLSHNYQFEANAFPAYVQFDGSYLCDHRNVEFAIVGDMISVEEINKMKAEVNWQD